jgi:hypothetical protein
VTDNPFDAFDQDEDALVITPPRVTGNNVFDAFDDDPVEPSPAKQTVSPSVPPQDNWFKPLADRKSQQTARESSRVLTDAERKNFGFEQPQTKDDASFWGSLEHGLGNRNLEAYADTLEHLADMSDDPSYAESYRDWSGSLRKTVQEDGSDYKPVFQSFKQINGLSDAWGYVKEVAGEQIGIQIPGIAGAITGGYLGQKAGAPLGKFGRATGGFTGATAGALSGMIHHHVSEMRNALKGERVEGGDLVKYTNYGTMVLAGLDLAFPVVAGLKFNGAARQAVARKVALQLAKGGTLRAPSEFIKRFGKEIVKDAILLEVPTEIAQEAVTTFVPPEVAGREVTDEEIQRFITETVPETAFRTAIGAGAVTTPGSALQAKRDVQAGQEIVDRDLALEAQLFDQGSRVARETKEDRLDVEAPTEDATNFQRRGERPAETPSENVIRFIRERGGIQPSGETDAMDASRYPGLVSQRGMTPDQAREALVEAGFLTESVADETAVTTPDDVYDLLDRAIRGERVVPVAEQAADRERIAIEEAYEFDRELEAAEQNFVFPALAEIDAEIGTPVLADAYRRLSNDDKAELIERVSREGEGIDAILEEMAIRNEDAPTIAAMAIRRGATPEQIEQLRGVIQQASPELATVFDELVASLPKPRQTKARKPAAPVSEAGRNVISRLEGIDKQAELSSAVEQLGPTLKAGEWKSVAYEVTGRNFPSGKQARQAVLDRLSDRLLMDERVEGVKRLFGRDEQTAPAPRRKEVGSTLTDFARASSATEIADRFNILQEDAASLLKRDAFIGEAKTIVERLAKKAAEGNEHAQNNDWDALGQVVGDMAADAAALAGIDARPEARLITQWVDTASRLAREGNIPVPERAEADPDQIRQSFASILNSKTPRSKWASELGISDAELAPLIDEAVRKGFLRRDRNGNVRRVPQSQRSGSFAAMVIPENLPDTIPGVGDVVLTPKAEAEKSELNAAIDRAAAKILPEAVSIDLRDNIAIATLRREDQMLAVREETAFRRWFGSSKIVDEQGNPLVVYHGAPDVRGIFKEGFQALSRGEVWFAAKDYNVADSYADDRRAMDYQNAEPQTIPLYLSVSNPKIIDAKGESWKGTEKQIKAAKDEGHDGVIIENVVDFYNNPEGATRQTTTVYAFFSPTQAKSAVGGQLRSRVDGQLIPDAVANRGTFDPTDPRISYALRTGRGQTESDPSAIVGEEETGGMDDYRGQHSAPNAESGSPIHDVTSNGIYPDDFYGPNGLRYYATGNDELDYKAYNKIRDLRGNPDAKVAIYRAIPKVEGKRSGVTLGPSYINPGDWVTITRDYAKDHGESALNGEYHLVKRYVPASELFTAGDSFLEWGWSPPSARQEQGEVASPPSEPSEGSLSLEGRETASEATSAAEISNELDRIDTELRSLSAGLGRIMRIPSAKREERRKELVKERGRLIEVYRNLPLEARAANVRDSMFALRGFHGSPHEFTRFDTSKIGTGEGTQMEGWGIYLSSSNIEGEAYRLALRPENILIDGEPVGNDTELQEFAGAKVAGQDYYGRTFDELGESIRAMRQKAIDLAPSHPRRDENIAEADAMLEKYERVAKWDVDPGDFLYEVEIDADADDFLVFHQMMSEQPKILPMVKAALEKAGIDSSDIESLQGVSVYDRLAEALGSEEFASKALSAEGVAGNSYKATMDLGADNYVVFDDSILKITKRNGEPVSGEERQQAVDQMLALRAFHGSPHDFDRFDLSRIGTGEGAQVFGHGLYFAENELTAKEYQNVLGDVQLVAPDGNVVNMDNSSHVASYYLYLNNGNADNAIKRIKSLDPDQEVTRLQDAISLLEQGDIKPATERKLGHLYEVEIDVEPEQLLDWDLPLSEQGEVGKKALAVFDRLDFTNNPERTVSQVKQIVDEKYGRGEFNNITVSELLRDAGIPGLRYLDQVSRATGDGTRNIVIFDDSLVKITKKNGKPVSAEERQGVVDQMLALNQPSQEQVRAAKALQEFAKTDDAFVYPKSDKQDVVGIISDTAEPSGLTFEHKSTDEIGFHEHGAKRIYNFLTGERKPFHVYEDDNRVWMDVSEVRQGQAGAAIYAAVANYALNTGRKFIGDPDGMSAIALRRRTENMLSSALKFGTTDHLEPHEDQIAGNEKIGVPPLQWTEGDTLGNIASLMETSVESVASKFPEIKDYRYDLATGAIRTGEGQPVSDGMLDALAETSADVRASRAGRRTLKRVILQNTLLQEARGAAGAGLLGEIVSRSAQSVQSGAMSEGIFYARSRQAEALGQTDPYTMTISIAMQAVEAEARAKGVTTVQEAVRVLRHEAVEFFKAMGLFTEKEWNTLKTAAKRNGWVETTGVRQAYEGVYKGGMNETEMNDLLIKEAIAEQYSEFHLNRKQFTGTIASVFQRIKDFIARISSFMRGEGFQTSDDVFTRIDEGEFKARFNEAFLEFAPEREQLADVAAQTLPTSMPNLPLSPPPPGPTPGLEPSPAGSLIDIQRNLRKRLGLTVKRGRLDPGMKRLASQMGGMLRGQYSRQTGVIRLAVLEDIDTEAHEVAHALESRYDLDPLKARHQPALLGIARMSGNDTVSEGFAEFFRLYLTNPQAAEAHAPDFFSEFEEFMDAQDPQTLADIQEIRDQYADWRDASSAGRITAAVKSGVPESTFQAIRNEYSEGGVAAVSGMYWRYLERVYKGRWDKTNSIRKVMMRIARQAERNNQELDLSAWRNPQMQAQKIVSSDAAAYIDLTQGVHWENSTGKGTVSLRDALLTAYGGVEFNNWSEQQRNHFGGYMIARRGRWLWQRHDMSPTQNRGRGPNPPGNPGEGDWYFDTMRRQRRIFLAGRWETELMRPPDKHNRADHEQAVADLEAANPQFAQASQMVYQFLRDLALKRYQAGLDSLEEYQYKTGTPDYVPWFRDMSDEMFKGTAVSGRKVAAKFAIKGSYRDFIDPIEGIARQVYDTNQEIAVNKPKLLLGKMADEVENAGQYVEIIPATRMRVEEVRIRDALQAAAIQEGLPPEDAKEMISTVASMLGEDAVAKLFKSEQAGEGRDAILHYMDNGVLKMLQIHDDGHGIAKDILGFFEMTRGTPFGDSFFDMITAAVRVPQRGITAHPGFLWRNLIRDTYNAAVLQAGYFPIISNIRTVLDNQARQARGEETWAQILARHGGIMGGINRSNIQQLRQGRVSGLRTEGVVLNPARRDFWARTVNPLHEDFWKWAEWSEANARQTLARLSFDRAFKDAQSRYPTMPLEQQTFIALESAVQRSRDYTDYGRSGDFASQTVFNRLVMFLNPALQGPDKMFRKLFLAQTDEGVFAAAQVVRKKLAPLFDDRQRSQAEKTLTKSEKDALKDAMRAWTTLAMIAVAHLMLELMLNDDDELRDKSELERALNIPMTINGQPYRIPRGFDIVNVTSNALRAQYDSWRYEDPTAWQRFRKTLGYSLVPPHSSPLLDMYIGWKHGRNNFFDSAIEPEYMQGRLPEDRYKAYTSKLSKDMAEGINAVAPFEVSPLMVEYTMNTLGSDWARDILRTYDAADPDKPALRWQEYPFIRTTRGLRGTRGAEDFWDLMGRDGGEFIQPAGSYKEEAVKNKVWTQEDLRKFFERRVTDDDARAYAILNGHYDVDQRRLHPMERAKEFITALSATSRQVAFNRVDDPRTGKRLEVTRAVRQQANEIMSEISRREYLNGLIAIQRPGYEFREPMPVKPYLEELKTVSPRIHAMLMDKIKIKRGTKVYDYDTVRELWPEVRRRLLDANRRETIIEKRAQVEFNDLNYAVGRARALGIR